MAITPRKFEDTEAVGFTVDANDAHALRSRLNEGVVLFGLTAVKVPDIVVGLPSVMLMVVSRT